MATKWKWRPKSRTLGVTGVLLMMSGIFLFLQFPFVFDFLLDKELTLSEHSLSTWIWKDIPIPIYMEFYMFNWTNPEDFNKAGVKPILEELGPYVYREHRKKVIDQWNSHNGTVTFRQNRTWHFEPSLSKGHPDDLITTVNIIGASAEFMSDHLDFFSKFLIDSAILSFKPNHYVKVKVREILFDGYEDPLLNLASDLPKGVYPHLHLPIDKLGWWYPRNGSADVDGIYNIKTGAKDGLKHFGEISSWNYKNSTDQFKSHCGAIYGSASELFPVGNPANKSVSVFSTEICRTIDFNYEKETLVKGIPASRYVLGKELFTDERTNPENWCFCTSKKRSKCPPSGVLELTGCKWGGAAFLSAPHFLNADPYFFEGITGMKPDPVEHQSFIDLDPTVRIPIRANVAFQINILVEEHEGFSLFDGSPRIFFPTVWFRMRMEIEGFYEYALKLIFYLETIVNVISYLLIIGGLLIILNVIRSLFVQSPRKISQLIYTPVPNTNPI